MRLLALMLVCGLIMGCFVGCGESESDEDEDQDSKSESSGAEKLRADLVKYKYQGLLVYLGDEMSELEDGYSSNEDDTVEVSVGVLSPEDMDAMFDEKITSAKTLAKAFEEMMGELDSEEVLDSGKKNGTYYLYGEAEDEQGVIGFYYKDGYGWLVSVTFTDEELKDTAIKYATICQVKDLPELEDSDPDDDYPDDDYPDDDYPDDDYPGVDYPDDDYPDDDYPDDDYPGVDYPDDDYPDDDYPDDDYPGVDYPDDDYPGVDYPTLQSITLKVWAPTEDFERGWLYDRLEAFEELYADEYEIIWDLAVCSEADAATMIAWGSQEAADVYFYVSDQLDSLVGAGALSKLGGSCRNQVLTDNATIMTQSVTYIDDEIYGFPVAPNTWFMYYDKSVFSESDIQSLETMLSKGTVSFDMANGWYNGAFFWGAGGTVFGPNGNDPYAGVDFNGAIGGAVAQKMVALHSHPNFYSESHETGWAGMIEGCRDAIFSGSWNYDTLKHALGDDLGVAVLPTFNVDGRTYQMKSFAGSKAIGVNAQIDDPVKISLAMKLAAFLASEESQLLRFQLRGITPTHMGLKYHDAILTDPIATVEMAVINSCAIMQPSIPAMGNYWTPMGNFGGGIISGYITEENAADMLIQTSNQINR